MRTLFFILTLCFTLSSSTAHAYEADIGYKFTGLTAKSSKELRVVWWNIFQGGKLGTQIEEKEGHNPLQRNLESITAPEEKPEFLILGEYRPDEVKPEIDQLLKSRYRFVHFIPYSSTYAYQGILILSDLPTKIVTSPVSWVDHTDSPEEKKSYRDAWGKMYPTSLTSFDRTLISIEYQWQGKTRYLLPFHAVQPWMPLQDHYPKRWAKYLTALEILTGTHNPLFHQLKEYLSKMIRINHPEKNSVLLVGDLNTPDSMLGISPIGYRLLTFYMKDAFIRGTTYTYPAPSSDRLVNKLKIDHALTSPSVHVTEAKRLPLRGSDHFPISVTIE